MPVFHGLVRGRAIPDGDEINLLAPHGQHAIRNEPTVRVGEVDVAVVAMQNRELGGQIAKTPGTSLNPIPSCPPETRCQSARYL